VNLVLILCFRKKLRSEANLDADEPLEDDSEDSDESEDEDDAAALMAELQRIKAERAAETARKVPIFAPKSLNDIISLLMSSIISFPVLI
jgi:protein CWC15